MGRFLRDENVKNISLNEESLNQLSELFCERAVQINKSLNADYENKEQLVSYIIRFDNKGHRFYEIDEAIRQYRNAGNVERFIITMDSLENINTNGLNGTKMEARFDIGNKDNCCISVSSENNDWVESSYSTLNDFIKKNKNNNGIIRTSWTPFLVQILGVLFGLTFSIWAALRISPSVDVENSFILSFLFCLLIYSNIWNHLNERVLYFIGFLFPNVRFERQGKERTRWLFQAIVGGISVALTLCLVNMGFTFIGSVIKEIITK